jgi:hypothetical protein
MDSISKTFLKDEIEKAGFLVSEPTPGVLLVENFLNEEDLKSFLDFINATDEKDWSILYLEGLKPFCLEKFGRDDVENLVAEGKFEITQGWEDKNLSLEDHEKSKVIHQLLDSIVKNKDNRLELNSFSLQRMQPGVELKSHTDQHTDPSIEYAAIIYLNDTYNGGEVFFENKKISLQPKAGSLLIFPGTEEFEHGVRRVKDGPIRYVIPSFIRVKNFYKENKY